MSGDDGFALEDRSYHQGDLGEHLPTGVGGSILFEEDNTIITPTARPPHISISANKTRERHRPTALSRRPITSKHSTVQTKESIYLQSVFCLPTSFLLLNHRSCTTWRLCPVLLGQFRFFTNFLIFPPTWVYSISKLSNVLLKRPSSSPVEQVAYATTQPSTSPKRTPTTW